MRLKFISRWLPLGLCAIAFAGCSTFNRDWKAAANMPVPTDDIQGRWEGTWQSDASSHKDVLQCLMTKRADGKFDARFHAKYKRGVTLTFGYTAPLNVTRDGDNFKFTGDADLGWYAGGVYHYEGNATLTNFFSTYSCKYDHGTFHMTRPKSP
jgi:hypothetical protein